MAGIVFAVVDRPGETFCPYTVQKRVGRLRGTVAHFEALDEATEAANRYAACHADAVVSVEAGSEGKDNDCLPASL